MVAEEVEGVDDLLTLILICLPPRSVFKFRCVSKKWNKIMRHPLFLKSYLARKRNQQLLGFIEVPRHGKMVAKIFPITQTSILKPSGLGTYINSSNGLILCCVSPRYYVVNPVTNARFILPTRSFNLWQMGLTCDENMQELAPSFKVIGFLSESTATIMRDKAKTVVIGTYSSTTGKWTTSMLSGPDKKFRLQVFYSNVYVSNGVFHWQADGGIIAVYDSKGLENHIQLIKEPPRNGYFSLTLTRSSRDDVLCVGEHSDSIVTVWMLPKDDEYRQSATIPKEKWIMAYKFSKDSLMLENFLPSYRLLCLEALIIGDTVTAILSGGGRAFIYDIEKKSIELVDSSLSGEVRSLIPYMEPSMSSYALSTSIH